jgi:aryl-alcohol dehydrogenase-like predicted oxidoreductase
LDSGWLSGKYSKDSVFEGVRSRWSREDIITRAELVEQLKGLPEDGETLAQFALQYCLAYSEVSTVIPGAVGINQLMANLESLKYPMKQETVQELEIFYEKVVASKSLVW